MRLLLTSDLHRDGRKLLWLLDEAPACDAVLVAGDFLDIFSRTGFTEQKSGCLRWVSAFQQEGRPLAWCSGNHDFFHGDHTPISGASPLWMHEKPPTPLFIGDGQSGLLATGAGALAVTTVPWPVGVDNLLINGTPTKYLDFVKRLLLEGKQLQQTGVPWIVLHHEPPAGTPLSATYSAPEAEFCRRLVEDAQPDFSLHGHVHQAPTAPGGFWICRIGKTVCFNAGQSARGELPHTILLDWRSPGDWTATWSGAGRTLHAQPPIGQPDA